MRDQSALVFVNGYGANRLADVARKTRPKVGTVTKTRFAQKDLAALLELHAEARRGHVNDGVEAVGVDCRNQNLVRNAAEKRFIGQFIRREIGGENDLQLERDVEFSA